MLEATHYPVSQADLEAPQSPNSAIHAEMPGSWTEERNMYAEMLGLPLLYSTQDKLTTNDPQNQEPPTNRPLNAIDEDADITVLTPSPTLTPIPVVQGPDTEFPNKMGGMIYEGKPSTTTCFPLFALFPIGFLALFTGRNKLSRIW